MLKALTIDDLAVVRRVDIEFQPGLTVLTGETGAGKSILVGALGLALGDRADSTMLRTGAARASVSATFAVGANPVVREILAGHGLDQGDDCILRRVLSADGRSRAFCNATPVPVQMLRHLGARLVDIHGQHAHQSLLRAEAQRRLVDEFGNARAAVARTRAAWMRWKAACGEIETLGGGAADVDDRRELLRYQVTELEALNLCADEPARLEADYRRQSNAAQLIDGCRSILSGLFDDEDSAAARLVSAQARLAGLRRLDVGLEATAALIDEAAVHLDEARHEIGRFVEAIEIDGTRLRDLEARLEAVHDLARKHRCKTHELPGLLDALRAELEALADTAARLRDLESTVVDALAEYHQAADALHHERTASAATMNSEIATRMRALGMPGATFAAVVQTTGKAEPGPGGRDHVEFLVSTNPDQEPRPLRKVASGGELSRISLAIQVATAGVSGVPVLVYDEIDAGVGGRVADILSRNLHLLARHRQVLCITHLPQVAAAGDHHLMIGKSLDNGVTHTSIRALSPEERVEELARMLAGQRISDSARAHARALLASAPA